MKEEIEEIEIRLGKIQDQTIPHEPLAILEAEISTAEANARRVTEAIREMRDRKARYAHRDDNQIARLEFRHRELLETTKAAERKVDYFAQLGALDHSNEEVIPPVADSAAPWWEGNVARVSDRALPAMADAAVDTSRVDVDDAETFVLARAAGLRHVGRGESVPLIIDGAFDDLAPEVASRLFDVLLRIGPIVQIVYLASNAVAEKWAKRQPEQYAAVVRLERL
jgi:hypothetical protein